MRREWHMCRNGAWEEGFLGAWRGFIPKGQISWGFPFPSSVCVFSRVDGQLEELKGEMCNSVSCVPLAGRLPERLPSLMVSWWCFHANRHCFQDIFCLVIIIKRFSLQIDQWPSKRHNRKLHLQKQQKHKLFRNKFNKKCEKSWRTA